MLCMPLALILLPSPHLLTLPFADTALVVYSQAIVKMEEKRGSPEEVKVHQAERHKTLEAKLLHDGVFEFDTSGVVEPAEKVVE